MANDFKKLFYPQSIAVVGASEEPESVGLGLCTNLTSYPHPVYFVNPKHQTLFGKECYPSLKAIQKPIDLAIIATPASVVPEIVEEAGAIGIKSLIIISAGFKESSVEGTKYEESVREICEKYGISMIGPNCLGVINPENHLNASFASTIPAAGSIAFISQSGALCASVIDYSRDLRIGFSKFVSIGNKTCVDEVSLIEYLANDPQTYAIFLYVEDIHNASAFVSAAYRVTHGPNAKPIVLLKGGRTDAGAKASRSHTGALGGPDAYYDAIARQAGIIRVYSISEFFNLALVISHNPKPEGARVAIVTNAGGPGILMTDEAVAHGLTVANGPIDLLGDAKAQKYKQTLELIAGDSSIDSTLVLLTPQSGTEIEATAQAIVGIPQHKPCVVSFMGKDKVLPGIQILRDAGVAVTEYPEDAARALGEYTKFALEQKTTGEQFPVFDDTGFPIVQIKQAATAEETVAAVKAIGKPCAIKINSPDIIHKTDVGGVMLNISEGTAEKAYDTIIQSVKEKAPQAKIVGVTVSEMAPPGGTEFIVGFTREKNFGTVIMVGMGGIYVEIIKDVAFGIAPLTKTDAIRMIQTLKSAPILSGFRGSASLDIDALLDCIGRVSQYAKDHAEIAELDINPLIVYPQGQGVKAVDVRLLPYPRA